MLSCSFMPGMGMTGLPGRGPATHAIPFDIHVGLSLTGGTFGVSLIRVPRGKGSRPRGYTRKVVGADLRPAMRAP